MHSDKKENGIGHFLYNMEKRYKYTFVSIFIWGIVAHGMALFNKFSFHDDAAFLFDVGGTYSFGRWMLGVLGELETKFFGGSNYSLPVCNGICTLLFFAIIACIFINLFEIRNLRMCVSLGGIMVTIPVVAGLFGYMYTAPYYILGMLLGVLGAFWICKRHKWYSIFLGILLISCCMGVYQAYYPVVISTFLLYMIKEVAESEDYNWVQFFRTGIYYILSLAGSVLLYFLLNRYFLWHFNCELSDYLGIDAMGKEPINVYLLRAKDAYRLFFSNQTNVTADMYPMNIALLYKFMLVVTIVCTLILLYKVFKKDKNRGIQLIILVAFIPLAVNFVYVMSETVHTLMVYGQVMFFVYSIWLLSKMEFNKKKIEQVLYSAVTACLLLFSVMYCRFDNACYLKAEFQQQQAISYFTTLITQIKSVDGYTDEMGVAFINQWSINDASVSNMEAFNDTLIFPYTERTLLNNYAWLVFMENWCGYSPTMSNVADFIDLPEVQAMPSYPDDGAIQIINNTVVVKF